MTQNSDQYAAIADLYDDVGEYRDRPDVDFYVAEALGARGPVLELGCGTGRVLIPTARAGVEVTGLDASPSMLAECRNRLAQEAEAVRTRVHLVQGDMRRFDLGRKYALVTLPFRPFQHLLTVEDQLACLAAIQSHLHPAGRVILDLFNPSLEALTDPNVGQETGDEPEFTSRDGRRVVRKYRIVSRDRARQVNSTELVYYITYPDGRQERAVHAFDFRYLFRFEAEHLLARAGFEVQAVYSDYNRSPFGSSYPGELILVARKGG